MGARGLRYMPALDGLRACAVLAVMLYHADVAWVRGGYFGVDAFFVLSGFLITSLLLGEWNATGRINLRAFWARRARRLLPALAVVVLAVVLYAARAAMPPELHQLRRDGLSTMFYVANWNQIVSHQSYFQQLAAPSLLRHTWSLAIEEQFYLCWPLAVFVLLRVRRGSGRLLCATIATLAAGSVVLMAVLYRPGHDPSRVYYGTDTRAQSLLVGALLALLLAHRHQVTTVRLGRVLHGTALAAAVALGYLWSTTSDNDAWQYRGGYLLAAVLVAVVIASVTQPGDHGPLGRLLSWAPLRAVGMISYGLYLWHWPVYVYLSRDRTGLNDAPLLLVRLAVTFAVATASFCLVERPVRRGALRDRTARRFVPAVASVLALGLVGSTAAAIPAQFSTVSAAHLQGPPPVVPPVEQSSAHATALPLRVMLVGDSVSASLAPGLAHELMLAGDVFWSVAVPGCGLASDVGQRWVGDWLGVNPRCLPPWRQRWAAEVAGFHPDIVVGLFGAQDTFDRRVDSQVIRFDTPAGASLAEHDLQDAITTLSSQGAAVVLLTAPYYVPGWPMKIDRPRSLFNPAWIDRWNSFEHAIAGRNAGPVAIVDLNRYLDPNGMWTDTINGIKVRTFDRMHLSADGAAYVAQWLVPQLRSFATRTGGTHTS
jgi:peptidoglycan/LPS O-acetylase OafA/YrhL